ncbi:hypothetical protein COOONC_16177 [Cooperia oncophora]
MPDGAPLKNRPSNVSSSSVLHMKYSASTATSTRPEIGFRRRTMLLIRMTSDVISDQFKLYSVNTRVSKEILLLLVIRSRAWMRRPIVFVRVTQRLQNRSTTCSASSMSSGTDSRPKPTTAKRNCLILMTIRDSYPIIAILCSGYLP